MDQGQFPSPRCTNATALVVYRNTKVGNWDCHGRWCVPQYVTLPLTDVCARMGNVRGLVCFAVVAYSI